ncbi:MAG: enoyl-CoA hydratase/isomerase family protein [Deltaproteobacteria bacterium]|nr:enoyl-CoA hydratase/isomerase family protein [Deltaproteobacteria bacterium]MBK8241349.1 enoyl-CoA hydratase/isomerase family protein [Deltaproteobacteria bacterium]MBK8717065.1 enoyl-CoA hydratase/isomerase family protein [Deltaproteobacteria bacterium]MBP7286412.1 enoyl-CoA hydratase/isomerase family protein [Nannocystaceae bacterium]
MAGDLLLRNTRDGVTTLTMNNPRRLNGWTVDMLAAVLSALRELAGDDDTKAVILTGTGDYYCAGVNLAGALQLAHPAKLHASIIERNQALFDTFLDFPKPILVAVNGPAIGASVTAATLCNGIVASERATFSTPFAALGVTPEGCSSVVFPRLLGASAARMLGPEGWKPTGAQAVEIGLAMRCVPHAQLQEEAHRIARGWIEQGVGRRYPVGMSRDQLHAINAEESRVLATAFLRPKFLMAQYDFLWRKKKRPLALAFLALAKTQPAWRLLLSPEQR